MKKTVQAILDEDTYTKLQEKCFEEDRTISYTIAKILTDYFENNNNNNN